MQFTLSIIVIISCRLYTVIVIIMHLCTAVRIARDKLRTPVGRNSHKSVTGPRRPNLSGAAFNSINFTFSRRTNITYYYKRIFYKSPT